MNLYEYNTPTKVLFGRGSEQEAGRMIRAFGGAKALVHYGGGSAVRSGLLERVCASLSEAGVDYVTLGGVVPNPRLSKVREGIALGRAEGVDFLLAVGGGSVLDSAKAIAYGLANEGDVWDFYSRKRVPSACLPVGTVLTLAATGSEMSNSSVITNEEGWLKRGCNNDLCRCRFALLNPELTATLPPYQTACGCTDILMHTLERYFYRDGGMEITASMAEALMRTVIVNAGILMQEPGSYEARAEVMWAGSLSHNGLTGFGTDGGDWACHQLEHELSGMFDVTHGAGLAAVWGAWSRYVMDAAPERFARFARAVMGVDTPGSDEETASRSSSGPLSTSSAPSACPPPWGSWASRWTSRPSKSWPGCVPLRAGAPLAPLRCWAWRRSRISTGRPGKLFMKNAVAYRFRYATGFLLSG